MFWERVAERVSSLSKLKSVLVTDSHAQLLQRPCSATYGHEQRRRRLPSSSGDALPEGWTVNSVRVVPSAPGRRCPPTYCQELGAVHLLAPCWCAPTFLAQVLVRLAGSRPPGRVSLGMESACRAQPVRSGLALGSGAIRLGWQAGSGSSGTVSAEWEGRNMHTCTHAHVHVHVVFRRQLST